MNDLCLRGAALYAKYEKAKSDGEIFIWKPLWIAYENHRDACPVCKAGDGGHTQPLQVAEVKK